MHRGVTRFTAVALLGFGCVGTSGPGTSSSTAGLSPSGVDFAAPSKLRPCCAFGTELGVGVAQVPVPMIELANVLEPHDVGQHRYDGGLLSPENPAQRGFLSPERNGLIYTCRGGFIDVAHVRDYADWTVHLALRLEPFLQSGVALVLPPEGGRRFVYLTALEPEWISRRGSWPLSVELAGWLAFQLSLWHEIAAWYGWSSIGLFPELASAFSPEDLYSNQLGIELAGRVLVRSRPESQASFNRDAALVQVLSELEATSAADTRRALASVDGLWWDSRRRLPAADLVLRRNLDLGPSLRPWRAVSGGTRGAPCSVAPAREWILTTRVEGIPIQRIARLDVHVERALAALMPLLDPQSHSISQSDFPAVVARVRQANREAFGEHANQPY